MTSSVLDPFEDIIKELIEEKNFTHKEIESYLQVQGLKRGTSAKNIALFCANRNIHRHDYGVLSAEAIQTAIEGLVSEVISAFIFISRT